MPDWITGIAGASSGQTLDWVAPESFDLEFEDEDERGGKSTRRRFKGKEGDLWGLGEDFSPHFVTSSALYSRVEGVWMGPQEIDLY